MRKSARRNIIYSILLLLVVSMVYLYRQNKQQPDIPSDIDPKVVVSGPTMGTTYRIVYLDPDRRDFKPDFDSLLTIFNQSLSTYIPDSEISRFNANDSLQIASPYFYPVLVKSQEVFEATSGAFDPTIGPLVNVWGFGPGGPSLEDSVNINTLLEKVGFEKLIYDEYKIKKLTPGIYLDFSAIAKGYGADVLAAYLDSRGITDYLVEIGGELVSKGNNENGELWRVGVSRPDEEGLADELHSIIALENKGMATSGNYRNFYKVDDKKYSHTISPFTGKPVVHGLLSATVVAEDCMTADAYATAFMVLGTEGAIEIQKKTEGLEIFLIFNDGEGNLDSYVSEGLKPYLTAIYDEAPE